MYYEPYKKRRGAQERERRGGCLPRALWFFVKFLFKLAVLLLVLAVVAYALPPGLFNVEPETDLGIATGLPDSHVNILVLGVDADRGAGQRSDTMMILSVGYRSLKLTSILRDTMADIDGYGRGKINGAYAYGGAELAMRTVNQTFQMNITKYVVVDYLTIARLVDAVGGVDIVISKAEMEQINANNARYAGSTAVAADLGYMPAPVREYSEDGETPVHLDGLQAVGYARIRKLDSDFVRTSRQRRVVQAVMTALRGQLYNPLVYARIVDVLCNNLETNMNAVEIASLGMKALVCGEIEQMRLPVDGTYDDNGSSITIDASANAQALREFIYD